jgi:hypothetical protein
MKKGKNGKQVVNNDNLQLDNLWSSNLLAEFCSKTIVPAEPTVPTTPIVPAESRDEVALQNHDEGHNGNSAPKSTALVHTLTSIDIAPSTILEEPGAEVDH